VGNTADLKSDRTFTGQKQDGAGLLYYNARYYTNVQRQCSALEASSLVWQTGMR
jgi:hypothetical protein